MATVRKGKRSLTVQKVLGRRTADDQLMAQVQSLCGRAIGKTLAGRGWQARRPVLEVVESPAGGHVATAAVSFVRTAGRAFPEESLDKHFAAISDRVQRYGRAGKWLLTTEQAVVMSANGQPVVEGPVLEGADLIRIPDDWQSHFVHIYDRDDQILEVIESVRTAKDTNMDVRNHCLLHGVPGSGKTEIGLALWRLLGEGVVKRLDATATTKAGAENLLLEMEVIPPVIILEELEKVNEANLPWLLGILDDRGEIIKTNARIGSVSRQAKCLVIATVNNLAKFESFQEGALKDRFGIPLYFGVPSRELLRRILMREVHKIPGGKEEWVEPALKYALEIEKTFQARRIKSIMTNARDRLLDGSFQRARSRMAVQRQEDKDTLADFGISGVS